MRLNSLLSITLATSVVLETRHIQAHATKIALIENDHIRQSLHFGYIKMAATLPPFPKFDLNEESSVLGPRWKKCVARFRNLVVALNITDKHKQRAQLLHYVGEEVNDILDILPNKTLQGKGSHRCVDFLIRAEE